MTTKSQTLRELFDDAAKNAARMFLEGENHEVLPMWHAVLGNDEHALIATPWRDDEEKQSIVEALRVLFRDKQVKRFVFMVEAWVACVTPPEHLKGMDVEEAYQRYSGPPASKHPDRREVLMIHAEDRSGESILGMYYILRPEHGPPKLSPLEVKPYEQTTGRMMGLLTERRT